MVPSLWMLRHITYFNRFRKDISVGMLIFQLWIQPGFCLVRHCPFSDYFGKSGNRGSLYLIIGTVRPVRKELQHMRGVGKTLSSNYTALSLHYFSSHTTGTTLCTKYKEVHPYRLSSIPLSTLLVLGGTLVSWVCPPHSYLVLKSWYKWSRCQPTPSITVSFIASVPNILLYTDWKLVLTGCSSSKVRSLRLVAVENWTGVLSSLKTETLSSNTLTGLTAENNGPFNDFYLS